MARRAGRIARGYVDVADHGAKQAEPQEHARFEEVALPDGSLAEQRDDRRVNRGVAVRWIEDVPVARRELRQERKPGVAESPTPGHRAKLPRVQEPIALRVVGSPDHDRRD